MRRRSTVSVSSSKSAVGSKLGARKKEERLLRLYLVYFVII